MELYIDWPIRDGRHTHSLTQMGSIKYHTTVCSFGLNVSEPNPGHDGYDTRAPRDSISSKSLIGWNPDISEEQNRVILWMKLHPQIIG